MVSNLNKNEDKITILYGDQIYHIFEAPANHLFYVQSSRDENCHIIGGLFGGKNNLVSILCDDYSNILNEMEENDCLESEESLLTVLYFRKKNMFNPLKFTTWHHDESDLFQYNHKDDVPFYKIFEKLNN
jgi:hypothetical protein